MSVSDPCEHDRFLVRRRRRFTVTPSLGTVDVYDFSLPAAEDRAGEPLCHVHQRVSRFNENIRFCTDDARTTELLRISARPRFDPWARYEVNDARWETIGAIGPPRAAAGASRRPSAASQLRCAYVLYDHQGNKLADVEPHPPAAPTRRLAGRAAIAGAVWLMGLAGVTFAGPVGLAGVISVVAATGAHELRARLDPVDAVPSFDITRDGELLGTHRRCPQAPELSDVLSNTLLGSRSTATFYEIDMSADRARSVDRRLVLALTVALDALGGLVPESTLR